MFRKWYAKLLLGAVALGCFASSFTPAHAQGFDPNRFYHYPYYYFPFDYWPSQSAQWPEPPGTPYRPAPAYMALPPFREPNWRYEWWQPQSYYRGFHFWLDQF
jgi:hypothetical protein